MKRILTAWSKWAVRLRLDAFTLYFAYRNPKTPWYAKLWSIVVVAYAFSPIDLIPDFIPIIGYLDDLVLVPLGVVVAIKLIPKDILTESRRIAQTRIDSKKPVNWFAAGIIIAIWISLITYAVYRVVRAFGK